MKTVNELILWKKGNVLYENIGELEDNDIKLLIGDIVLELKKFVFNSKDYNAEMCEMLSKPYLEIRNELIEILNNELIKRK